MSEYLSEELMVEIFTRLPVRCVLRFRSVSKSLRSCIDSPNFIRMHASRSPHRIRIAHMFRDDCIEKYLNNYDSFFTVHAEDELPLCGYNGIKALKFPQRDLSIIGSCKGIICLLDFYTGKVSLWNPAIMRLLTLPDCPWRCVYVVGFGIGFDPITDDNKIVSIPLNGDRNGESAFVYAMKTHAWRPIASPVPLYSRVLSRSFYHKGVFHWAVQRCFPIESYKVELGYIMTFDLSTHVFGMIDLPNLLWETYQISTLQGSLAVISTVDGCDWFSVRRDDSWPVVFKSETIKAQEGLRKVLELSNNGDLLLDAFRDGLQVYNPETGSQSTLVNFNDTSLSFDIDTYVETLQLLDIGTACDVNQPFLQEKSKREFS